MRPRLYSRSSRRSPAELEGADVLSMIADEARRLTDTTQGAVYLLDGDEFVVSVISGLVGADLIGYRIPVEDFGRQAGDPIRPALSGQRHPGGSDGADRIHPALRSPVFRDRAPDVRQRPDRHHHGRR